MIETGESWLSGPIDDVNPYLMPVAHALTQVGRDLERVVPDLTVEELWQRPAGAASIGFHLQHIAGVLERLLTYARDEELSSRQVLRLRSEGQPGDPPADAASLLGDARAAVERALGQVRATDAATLLESRAVGRKRLPSSILGLLYHAAEHVTRHTGQIVTTAKIVRGGEPWIGR
jgi:hypothetical protein